MQDQQIKSAGSIHENIHKGIIATFTQLQSELLGVCSFLPAASPPLNSF